MLGVFLGSPPLRVAPTSMPTPKPTTAAATIAIMYNVLVGADVSGSEWRQIAQRREAVLHAEFLKPGPFLHHVSEHVGRAQDEITAHLDQVAPEPAGARSTPPRPRGVAVCAPFSLPAARVIVPVPSQARLTSLNRHTNISSWISTVIIHARSP